MRNEYLNDSDNNTSHVPLTETEFKTIMRKIVKANEFKERLEKAIRNYSNELETDFMSTDGVAVTFESDLVDLLDNIFKTDLISYWIYNCNYGRDTMYKLQDSTGSEIYINTLSELYKVICENYNVADMHIRKTY